MKHRSKYAQFFDLIDNSDKSILASCKFCPYTPRLKSSTSSKTGLRTHLKSKHPAQYELLELEESFDGTKSIEISGVDNNIQLNSSERKRLGAKIKKNILIEPSDLGEDSLYELNDQELKLSPAMGQIISSLSPLISNDEQDCLNKKRSDYINWDEFFMGIALLSAQRSKDPQTQVGACIANAQNVIVGIGYNGMPIGCHDDEMPWGKFDPDPLNNKKFYVCHAEMNAILNKNCADIRGSTLYSTMFPCCECAKMIIQSGIRRVIFLLDKSDKIEMKASKRLFDMTNIEYRQFVSDRASLELRFDCNNF